MKINFLSVFLEAYFRHLLGALPAWNTLFELLCGIFASQIFYELTCYLNGGSYLNYLTSLKHVHFHSHSMYILAIMLIFDQELTKSTDINLKDVFAFHPLFHFRLVMK